jgi:hypothetical protein
MDRIKIPAIIPIEIGVLNSFRPFLIKCMWKKKAKNPAKHNTTEIIMPIKDICITSFKPYNIRNNIGICKRRKMFMFF